MVDEGMHAVMVDGSMHARYCILTSTILAACARVTSGVTSGATSGETSGRGGSDASVASGCDGSDRRDASAYGVNGGECQVSSAE
jgi:hypothetical protein